VLEAISATDDFSEVSDCFSLQLPPLHDPEHQGSKRRKPEILLEKPDPRTCLEEGIGTKSKQEIEQSFLILPMKLLSNEHTMIAQLVKDLPAMQKTCV